jgi:hypothetical protein
VTTFDGPCSTPLSVLEARGINKSIEDIRDQMYPSKDHWAVPLPAEENFEDAWENSWNSFPICSPVMPISRSRI